MSKIIVLDPGHGGTTTVGGSSPNNATSFSGVLEKTMVLDMANRILLALNARAPEVQVILTRVTDVNVGISARARVAANHQADLFLSLHFNATAGARGVETWIRGVGRGNINFAGDREFARRIQSAMVAAIRSHDSTTPDRGVKSDDDRPQGIGVLNDVSLGNSAGGSHLCRACLAEIEFIDHPAVDRLFNTGTNVETVRNDVASAIAEALLAELGVAFSADAILLAVPPNDGPGLIVAGPADNSGVPTPETIRLGSKLFSGNAALEAVADETLELTNSSQRREEVGLVQDALILLAGLGGNYQVDLGSSRQFRGFYGPKTRDAVMNFERDFHLTTNGIVDAETLIALDRALTRNEQGFNPLPVLPPAALTPGAYSPPPASAGLFHGVDFSKADAVPGAKYLHAYASADADQASGDPSNCKALLKFPQALFFEAKMAICADGSPRALVIYSPYGQRETAFTFPRVANGYFNAEEVPYIVLPGKTSGRDFVGDFGIKPLDLGVVIANGQVTPAFYGEVGPTFRIGEASIQVHENLPVRFPWTTTAKTHVRNASVPGQILYLVFPGTAIPRPAQGMSPAEWLTATLEAATARFEAFVASGGTA